MGLEQWSEINFGDPFERGPRAYFSGTGGKEPEDFFLEGADFDVEPDHQSSVFTHPWLGELRIQHKDTVILTLTPRLDSEHVRISFHDKDEAEEQSSLKSVTDFPSDVVRVPLVYYPSKFSSLFVDIEGPKKLSFSFYGLTERVQGAL